MKNISLIGLMGAGKSTVGVLLADYLKMNFVDIDEEIEKRENLSISEIFAQRGEDVFRNIESLVMKDFLLKSNFVVSTGGGAVQNPDNLELLKKHSLTIYLKAHPQRLFERIKNDESRPLLQNSNPLQTLEELLKKREKNYLKADIIVDTDEKTSDEAVKEIIKYVKS